MKKKSPASKLRAPAKAIDASGSHANLQKVFEDHLKDIYHGEKNLMDALPKLSKATTSEELKQAYHDHLHETKKQVKRLDRVFELLGKKAQAVQEAAVRISEQKIEQLETAAYSSLKAVAGVMHMKECHGLIEG
jgi:ferritin-like metal-binding protein YciE